MAANTSGNSALRPQIGVIDVESVIDTHSTDLTGTGVSLIPTFNPGDGVWVNFTSGNEATLALACEDAGYISGKFEFSAGVQTSVRIPLFSPFNPP